MENDPKLGSCCNREPSSRAVLDILLIIVVSIVVRAAYVAWLPSGALSFDLRIGETIWSVLRQGGNPYNDTHYMNWPPFLMQVYYGIGLAANATGMDFVNAMRVFAITMECVIIAVLYITVFAVSHSRKAALVLLLAGISLNPVCVYQVCQHLTLDGLVSLWILLAVIMMVLFRERGDDSYWMLASLFVGLGVLTKTVPLSLAPLLGLGLGRVKPANRFLGAVLLLGPSALGLSVVYVLGPEHVRANVFGYRSWCTVFGVTGYLNILWGETAWRFYAILFPRFYIVFLGLAGLWCCRRHDFDTSTVILGAVALLLSIPVFGTGWGMQYAWWFIPPMLLLFVVADANLRRWLIMLHVVTIIGYTFEYAVNGSLGAFLLAALPGNGHVETVAVVMRAPEAMTWARTPMYLLMAAVFTLAVRRLTGLESASVRPMALPSDKS